ncbi:unnamed protein product [Lactuca saligna]|uniref:Uncharacterized protein n=1 Tax=Lactuca saligna TaxID=75948 RepID=A0AA35Y6S9_LACSI|nr:unnamed protein product [Lactuca saligna]
MLCLRLLDNVVKRSPQLSNFGRMKLEQTKIKITKHHEPQEVVDGLAGRNTSVKGVAVHVFNNSFVTTVVEAKGYGSSASTRDPKTKKKYSPDRYHTFDTGEFKMMSGNYTTIDNKNVFGSVLIQLSKPFPHLEHKARSQALLDLPAMPMKESKIPSFPLEEASMKKPLATQTCKLKTGGKIIGFKSRAPIYLGFRILLQIKSGFEEANIDVEKEENI